MSELGVPDGHRDETVLDGHGESTLEVEWRASPGPYMLEIGSSEGGRSFPLRGTAVLGSGKDADLRIEDRTVSARHCAVSSGASGVVVEDLSSKNGMFVGGARVARALLPGRGASFVIGRTIVTVREAREDEPGDAPRVPGLYGASVAIRRVAEQVRRHAALRAPVLLQGESGTGKDVVARALHVLSGRQGAYVPLNVGAIPEALADAELFGHLRGAFTGAVAARPGAFELAQRGTLFLDEVAELAPSLQVKLLRIVEDGKLRPLGATRVTQLDVRLISATWAPLEERASEGRFRADLLHRLATVVIRMPPLRQRKSDIPCLCEVLLARHEPELGKKRVCGSALSRLVEHSWPGNVRELGSVLYRAAVASPSEVILAEHVELPTKGARPGRSERLTSRDAVELLQRHGGNVTSAAHAARVPRSTFRAWLEKARASERG